jgi:hypothetical protein
MSGNNRINDLPSAEGIPIVGRPVSCPILTVVHPVQGPKGSVQGMKLDVLCTEDACKLFDRTERECSIVVARKALTTIAAKLSGSIST